jgi:hypothetical protein
MDIAAACFVRAEIMYSPYILAKCFCSNASLVASERELATHQSFDRTRLIALQPVFIIEFSASTTEEALSKNENCSICKSIRSARMLMFFFLMCCCITLGQPGAPRSAFLALKFGFRDGDEWTRTENFY